MTGGRPRSHEERVRPTPRGKTEGSGEPAKRHEHERQAKQRAGHELRTDRSRHIRRHRSVDVPLKRRESSDVRDRPGHPDRCRRDRAREPAQGRRREPSGQQAKPCEPGEQYDEQMPRRGQVRVEQRVGKCQGDHRHEDSHAHAMHSTKRTSGRRAHARPVMSGDCTTGAEEHRGFVHSMAEDVEERRRERPHRALHDHESHLPDRRPGQASLHVGPREHDAGAEDDRRRTGNERQMGGDGHGTEHLSEPHKQHARPVYNAGM